LNPVCVALDARDPSDNIALAQSVAADVGYLKIGLTSFTAGGADLATRLAAMRPLFVDLKLHDIPAQVGSAVENIGALGASLATVHAAGGPEMVKAAVAAAPPGLKVVAVTVLTSLDDPALDAIGMKGPAEEAVVRLADMALGAGADGLVCSPLEVARLRDRFGPDPFLVVPGIRASAAPSDDQKRTLSAREALDAGASLLVVGRPITGAPDPVAAARDLAGSLS
jgi:orotidine-5'-phosphate decarboxylase